MLILMIRMFMSIRMSIRMSMRMSMRRCVVAALCVTFLAVVGSLTVLSFGKWWSGAAYMLEVYVEPHMSYT